MKKNLEFMMLVLFWGSIWGIIEATLGYACHAFNFRGASVFLYSFGIFCMLKASTQTGRGAVAIMLTAVVAALFKLIDFLLPTSGCGVINPAIWITLEGLMFAAIASFFRIEARQEVSARSFAWERAIAVPAFVAALVLTLVLSF